MNKVLIVIMFILLGTSLIVVSNMNKGVENSFTIEYQNNKNLSFPDLTGGVSIAPNVFRLHNGNGSTLDYNVNTGVYYYKNNGNSAISIIIINDLSNILTYLTEYTFTYNIISGTINTAWRPFITIGNMDIANIHQSPIFQINDISPYNYLRLNWGTAIGDYEFTIQIEKGSQSTSYVVPKLIPVYKDNLSMKEKQEIGLGAFAGFTEIIRNINGFIKPIGNFINGILSWF